MFTEDLDAFVDDFGVEVVFTRASSPVATATLIYDAPSADLNVYDRSFYDQKFYEAKVQGNNLTLHGVESRVSAVQTGDVATIGSNHWYVIVIDPDGTGMTTLTLSVNSI